MISLSTLLAQQAPLLLLDCASTVIRVGWLNGDGDARWASRQEEAGTGLFAAVEHLEREVGPILSRAQAFAFNHGPGSILGIRTAAVALRTWNAVSARPLFAFSGLQALAHFEAQRTPADDFFVVADARRESWHALRVTAGGVGPLLRLPTAELSGACRTPSEYRAWSQPPRTVVPIDYPLDVVIAQTSQVPLFHRAPEPEAFQHEDPSYQKWSAQIHRAPV